MNLRLAPWLALTVQAVSFAADYSFDDAQAFLKSWCQACHQGNAPAGGFHVQKVEASDSLLTEQRRWTSLTNRVRNMEMPPKGSPAPSLDAREQFMRWADGALRAQACATGPAPGPAVTRRLNRDEYAATIRDLLDMHLDLAQMLPADGAGGEGFDNAAETLFLSPLLSEKYMETAKFVTDFAAKEFKSKEKIFTAKPGPGVSPSLAARRILERFLPRAFRRPVTEEDIAPYLSLYEAARKTGLAFEPAVLFAIRGALVSPNFLYRVEPPNFSAEARPLGAFALASRISYFIWGSMPDELLFDVAAAGKLQDPEVLRQLVRRMLRNDRSLGFSQRFVEQWLHTRDLSGEKAPDPKLFPTYAQDEELRGDIRFQPILFFREVFVRNRPLLDFLDSKHTIGTSNLEKHFGVTLPLLKTARKQPQWIELPEGSHRGGLLGMPAVLAVSSYPYRTSPVLRGVWILDSILGTPPPPPPPNVPALDDPRDGAAARSVRERLEQHRANPACGGCHSRIDGLGFALENYDPIGRWRDRDGDQPLDTSGSMADGATFDGPDQLKALLLQRKDVFIRNLTRKMLGYALGRSLTLKDSCAVDAIVAQLKEENYSAQALIDAIVLSQPFRYQAGTPAQDSAGGGRKEGKKL